MNKYILNHCNDDAQIISLVNKSMKDHKNKRTSQGVAIGMAAGTGASLFVSWLYLTGATSPPKAIQIALPSCAGLGLIALGTSFKLNKRMIKHTQEAVKFYNQKF